MDRIDKGEADAAAESARSGQNLMRSGERRVLARSGKISPDPMRSHLIWNLYVAVRDLALELNAIGPRCGSGAQRDLSSPVVEIQISCFFLWNWKENEREREGDWGRVEWGRGSVEWKIWEMRESQWKNMKKMRKERESVRYMKEERVFLFYKY